MKILILEIMQGTKFIQISYKKTKISGLRIKVKNKLIKSKHNMRYL